MRINTTSAGPLCISHTDAWGSKQEHADTETYIRLYPLADSLKAFAVAHVIAKDMAIEQYLQEVNLGMQTERGIKNLRVHYVPGARDGQISYEMDDSDGKARSASGFISVKKHGTKLTRFDFVAEDAFYTKNYKEALIMADSIQLVE